MSFVALLILLTVGLNTLAQTLLKLGTPTASPGQPWVNPYLVGGIVAYGLSTLFYIRVLGKFNLSFVYPMIIGLTVVVTTLSGAWLLREKVAIAHWIGIGLMLSGLGAIAFAKTASP